jgi:hypothetical protein
MKKMRLIALGVGVTLATLFVDGWRKRRTRFFVDAYRDIETRNYWAIMSIYGIAALASFYRAWVGID